MSLIPPSSSLPSFSLADQLEDLLPQTQCTKCGYSACRPYAEAVAEGKASYNQCPPGGEAGVARLAALLDKPVIPLNPAHGSARSRPVAWIDEAVCIGCTLCIQACPVDAIIGAPKQMHTVWPEWCTGCDLCVAPCPVDCIHMLEATPGKTGWDAWSQAEADAARSRYQLRTARLEKERREEEARLAARAAAKMSQPRPATTLAPALAAPAVPNRKQAIIQAALERARRQRQATSSPTSPSADHER